METEYSVEIYRKLEEEFYKAELHRPMYMDRFVKGTELTYDVTGVDDACKGRVHLEIDRFVGGGFAGQVYRVKIINIESDPGPIGGLKAGEYFAMKILIPPSTFSRLFRNTLYWLGFQGPFQLQVNPTASRSGALWQKFIRKAAGFTFGDECMVSNIHATLVDSTLGSCGELSEWIEGRTWRLEVDENLDNLKRWMKGKKVNHEELGSSEYRAKHEFMHNFVEMLHQMGAHEFARQYEWSTWKSQPNCLKRKETEEIPDKGLVAVDFRAGMTLLPFLPISPGDFKLIVSGIKRGSLVQFDRGNIEKLESFINDHADDFEGMERILEELKHCEQVYRDSIPDITHNHVRLLYSSKLWSTILSSAITGWKTKNLIEDQVENKLRSSKFLTLIFLFIGFIPLLGRFIRRLWGQPCWRKHYKGIFSNWSYFKRGIKAKLIEKIIIWHRAGRVDDERALKLSKGSWRSLYHVPLSILPAGLHRIFTDWKHLKERFSYYIFRPVRLYFNNELREEWLREMVTEGQGKHLLTDEDAEVILSQVKEPYIQKYLKSLAVHLCTLPVTQVVSLIVAIIYIAMHPEMPRTQAYSIGIGIIALFQVVPISPGSMVRGLYVLYLVIKEKNFKDYNIAVFLGFFKYIGYLAFPIQMAYRYPAMARFMAGHWATEAVHIVPVFGEHGALLEHKIFGLFYNWPLTIRLRMGKIADIRTGLKPRYWHIILCIIAGSAIFGAADYLHLSRTENLPGLKDIWYITIIVPLIWGAVITLGAGGAAVWKRIVGSCICGISVGVIYTGLTALLPHGGNMGTGNMISSLVWRIFIFAILSVLGVLLTEINLPEPKKS